MRFVAIALILISLPVFIALLGRYQDRRDWALFGMGTMLFLVGTLQVDAALVSWRLWQGVAKGIFISPMDTISIALIMTRNVKKNPVHYAWLILLYLIPSLISLFLSRYPIATLFIPVQILRILIMFYALAGELHRPSAFRNFLAGISFGLMIQCGFVVREKLAGVVQARGTVDHQNILGMMIELSAIPLLVAVLEGQARKIAYLGLVAALIIVAGGGSRATMAFTTVGLATSMLVCLARHPNGRKFKFLGVFVLVSLIVVPLGAATLKERFGNHSVAVEDEERPAFERAAKAIAADYPLGIGANNYVRIALDQGYSQRAGVSWGGGNLAAPVHNSYLLMRAETGWLGESVMLLVLFFPILTGLRVGFSDRKSQMVGVALGPAIAAAVVALHSNYEYAWHLEAVQRLFFSNLAIVSACLIARERIRRSASKLPRQNNKVEISIDARPRRSAGPLEAVL